MLQGVQTSATKLHTQGSKLATGSSATAGSSAIASSSAWAVVEDALEVAGSLEDATDEVATEPSTATSQPADTAAAAVESVAIDVAESTAASFNIISADTAAAAVESVATHAAGLWRRRRPY